MRLLFCIKSMGNSGGAERVLADVASALVQRGHDVTVLSYDRTDGHSYYSLDPQVGWIRLDIGSTSEPASILPTLRRILSLRQSVRAHDPDVVIGFMHSMFIPLGLALVGTGIPVVSSEHIVPEHYRSRPIESVLLRMAPYLSQCITCVSEQAKAKYPRSLRRKMVIVRNPLGMKPAGRADACGTRVARKVLLSVGRLEPQKDHATLIEAFAEIAGDLTDWDLRIVGEGHLRPTLERLIADRDLQGRVQLPGATKDIATEYVSAQLFVVPSLYESFGLTTAEALAHGLPAVGYSDCAGTNQLIRPGVNGDLVGGGSHRSAALAKSLKRLMHDGALRTRLSQHSGVGLDDYRIEKVCDCWEEVLSRAMGRYEARPVNCSDDIWGKAR